MKLLEDNRKARDRNPTLKDPAAAAVVLVLVMAGRLDLKSVGSLVVVVVIRRFWRESG